MSDNIYGSSLSAAKSKANYLFEGDFRRRPNQNLSGASRSLARGELLQQAAEQRQNREDIRKREQASQKLQSVWRGYRCRKHLGSSMRTTFDNRMNRIKSLDSNGEPLDEQEFNILTREFIIYYHSEIDEYRFEALIRLMMSHQEAVIAAKKSDPSAWLFKMIKLLRMNLKSLRGCASSDSDHFKFLEQFTRQGMVLNDAQAAIVWRTLVESSLYRTLRHNVEMSFHCPDNQSECLNRLIVELVRRSLDTETVTQGSKSAILPVCSFFKDFLKGPLNSRLENFYITKLQKLKPRNLNPKNILAAFSSEISLYEHPKKLINYSMTKPGSATSKSQVQECNDAIWLCYSFVRMLYAQLDQLEDPDKANYIYILSIFLSPAEYITNISLMEAANDEDVDSNENGVNDPDETNPGRTHHYYTEINTVITRLVNLINDLSHINSLKSIIFGNVLNPQVQVAIIRICNLMLTHEPLAIFNCRLLYTIAFSREFSRSLWKSIITATRSTLYGANTPIYLEISGGTNVSLDSWKFFLPKLRLFCSLYSYLLPTLDDEEFYTDESQPIYTDGNNHRLLDGQQQSSVSKSSSSFFLDKELISISAILRDVCIGFIEILYQDRNAYQQSSLRNEYHSQSESFKILSFEMKLCFKALVRLICQLHTRDSRKQFCPDGHWICPSVAIPANKAVDFQLVTSQQGRLLSHMTKDEKSLDRMPTTSSEIKTVLILQEIPFVISFHDRVQIFHRLLHKERLANQSEGYHFGLPGTAIQVQIRRNYIYEDAFEKLSSENEPNMKLPLKVSLINSVGVDEAGIDGGGLSKEFLGELLKAGFDPMRGFFKSTKDQLVYPNPSANVLFSTLPEGYEIHYEFLGRILGKAIFEKIMVELPLASFFLAKLLARKHSSDVDLHNLASLDPVLYKNLVYLKNYRGDVADLNLDFTISNNELGEHEVVELKPGGSKIPVTRENKIEYVHLVADYRLNKQIRAQCAAFKRGLAQLIDLDWLRMFDPRELQILISGAPTVIDISDWRRNTLYANGYSDDCEAINTFWRVAHQFDESQKRKLLKFATSCSLPPLLGFKDLVPQFTIAPTEETRLPTASTCMNLLKLPEIEDESVMRSKLLYAIESNSGFELS